uniref:Uncharacterized protein n=1 Tax=Megaviridae environmental sample TaxID=1737588 RepID=A0A5J6VJX8_9VIRU|nr:MAG: hypothetical protein [Megaviridae environmental sample]
MSCNNCINKSLEMKYNNNNLKFLGLGILGDGISWVFHGALWLFCNFPIIGTGICGFFSGIAESIKDFATVLIIGIVVIIGLYIAYHLYKYYNSHHGNYDDDYY